MIPRKVLPGETPDFSARTHGAFVDAVEAHRVQQMEQTLGQGRSHPYTRGIVVQVLNQSGKVVPWYGVLELGDPRVMNGSQLDEVGFKQRVYLNGALPSADWESHTYGITQHPINEDCVGEMLVEGIVQVKVYIADTESLEYHYAIPIEGNVDKLEASPTGLFEILWSEKKVGDDNWAIIRFPVQIPNRHFELKEALVLGGSATVLLLAWDGDSYEQNGTEFTIYDFQKKHSKPATTSGADGAFGIAQYWPDRGEWEISSMSVPMHFNALAKGAVDSGDATYTVDNLEPLYGCYSHVLNSAEEVTVTNRFADDIDDNAKVTITWNASQNIFQTADITCPA